MTQPHSSNSSDFRTGKRTHSRTGIIAIAAVVVVLLALGIVPRMVHSRAMSTETSAASDTIATASVATAKRAAAGPLVLPGTLQPLHETVVYARSAGYVRRWYADIGTHVTTGQVLATIEAPEVDQEVQQAQAQFHQATATLALAKSDLDRWQALARDSAVSQQELDQKTAAYQAGLATVNAQRANVQRFTSLQGYSKVMAPFAGVVTARNVDVGTLVNPGTGSSGANGGTGGQGLFRVSQSDTMRVYVNVPQGQAAELHTGQSADVTVPEIRNRTFTGTVARTADALDPSTRTLLVEIDVPNRDHALLAGSFAQVKIGMGTAVQPIVVPANALLFNTGGTQIVVVDQRGVAHYHKVEVGRDYGATVEILSGIDDGATVVLNPSDDVKDGHAIRAVHVSAGKS
ncbi:MAG: efflux RND transporter periplasmic adaptor subunit [Gemmatimonadaceae bacterium]